jgi:hypothetical protein
MALRNYRAKSPLPQIFVPSSGGVAGMLDMVAEQKFAV